MKKAFQEDICMCLHNCADCYDEETRKTTCNPAARIKNDIFAENEQSFCTEYYPGTGTQEQLRKAAHKNGYSMIIFPDQNMICFNKKK